MKLHHLLEKNINNKKPPFGFFDVVNNNAKIKTNYSYSLYKLKLKEYYSQFFKNLTKKEISFLHKIITYSKIEIINRNINNLSKKYKQLANKYSLILSQVKLPISIHVWRTGLLIQQPYLNDTDLYVPTAKFTPGNKIISKHFMSISLDPMVTWLYQFIIPKNTPALYFDYFLNKSNYKDVEVSFLSNMKMEIKGKYKIKNLNLVFANILN